MNSDTIILEKDLQEKIDNKSEIEVGIPQSDESQVRNTFQENQGQQTDIAEENLSTFDKIQRRLGNFDMTIIQEWDKKQKDITDFTSFAKYTGDIPNFEIKSLSNSSTGKSFLYDYLFRKADSAEQIENDITMDSLREFLTFPAQPTIRPFKVIINKKKKSKGNDQRSSQKSKMTRSHSELPNHPT